MTFGQQISIALSCLFVLSCTQPTDETHLDEIKDDKVLVIGTLYSPTSYFEGEKSAVGMDSELAQQFAAYLGVELQIVSNADLSELFAQMNEGKIDIIASGLTVTQARLQKMRFGPPFYQVSQQIVFKQGKKRPRKLKDLTGTLMVAKASSHVDTLSQLKLDNPDLNWQTTNEHNPDELLKLVIDEQIDYTLADSNVLARNRRIYPDLSLAFTVTRDDSLAWALADNDDDSLYSQVIAFFGEQQSSGAMAQLEEKYFGHVQRFDYVDTRAFIKAIDKKLPKYQILFELNADGIKWEQLAALSYQESHWNPRAKSPTGVRGMMMLTLPTAKQMGVKSRLNAEQSIEGGAKYLKRLLARLPESIPESQRFWFALASYNVGYGHLMDARKLAQQSGKNPNSWSHVKQMLPLLEKKKYYRKTKHGYARGREAVHYVDSIRRYYDTLIAMDLDSKLAPIDLELAARIDSLPIPPQIKLVPQEQETVLKN
ncbi:membrane-bound lytic murein transglycosylase MltF [Psychrobium sp. MM17-31]|uniref:membrane-bound lytic murein transglycosylase MltF n=1 Tax=Psychrobium sp. MM17-31 TaxID=2917758 RepID=UPI0023B8433E|nr:membrane-bound lytic murein transglycosylase MltF [Psychrobium sp. MM17-31]